MIPYAVVMMNIIFSNGENLETRILNPIEDGVSFRLLEMKEPIRFVFYFLDYKNKKYIEYSVNDFWIEKEKNHYLFHTKNKVFLDKLHKIEKDYMHYIYLKTECDDFELMEEMAGLSLNEEFYNSLEDWKKNQLTPYEVNDIKLKNVDIAISIDTNKLLNKFLYSDWDNFLDYYWEENALNNHPITKYKVTSIYIGNQYCPLLQWDVEIINRAINKAKLEQLVPIVVFSTMPETLIERNRRVLEMLPEKIELVMNDLGMIALANSMDKGFTISMGLLLNKRKKDPRLMLSDENSRTSINAEFYRSYLMEKYNIKNISYEVCGYPIEIANENGILHLPLYQTNTSGHCTLAALCKYGDRAKQDYQTECKKYCEEIQVLYSKGTAIVGVWNSLFSCSDIELNNFKMLNEMIDKGIKRLVIRL